MRDLVSTGVDSLDELLNGGFEMGSSVMFYGPPGDGKSFVMWKTAVAAARAGKRVLYFSLHHLKENKAEKMGNLDGADFEMVDTIDFRESRNGLSSYMNGHDVVVIDSLSDFQGSGSNWRDVSTTLGEILYQTKKQGLVTVMSLMHHPSLTFPPFLEKCDYLIELSEEFVNGGSAVRRSLFVRKTPRHMHEKRYRYTIRDDQFVIEEMQVSLRDF